MKKRLRVDKLMMKEEVFHTCCNDEIAIAIQEEEKMLDEYEYDIILDSLDEWRCKVSESILHHPFTITLCSLPSMFADIL